MAFSSCDNKCYFSAVLQFILKICSKQNFKGGPGIGERLVSHSVFKEYTFLPKECIQISTRGRLTN